MADITKEELKKEIEEVVKTVDLNKTGIKHVIKQLEKRLGRDLSSQKKLIDQLVMDYVNSLETDESEEEEEVKKKESSDEGEEEKDDVIDDDVFDEPVERLSKKRKRGEDKKKKTADDKKKKTPKAKKGGVTKKGKGSAFTRPYKLTPALAELMGAAELPRYEVVKRMSAIIKERQLLDPNNRQFTICDKELYNIFGTQRFHTFGMMKYLKHHFLKDE